MNDLDLRPTGRIVFIKEPVHRERQWVGFLHIHDHQKHMEAKDARKNGENGDKKGKKGKNKKNGKQGSPEASPVAAAAESVSTTVLAVEGETAKVVVEASTTTTTSVVSSDGSTSVATPTSTTATTETTENATVNGNNNEETNKSQTTEATTTPNTPSTPAKGNALKNTPNKRIVNFIPVDKRAPVFQVPLEHCPPDILTNFSKYEKIYFVLKVIFIFIFIFFHFSFQQLVERIVKLKLTEDIRMKNTFVCFFSFFFGLLLIYFSLTSGINSIVDQVV